MTDKTGDISESEMFVIGNCNVNFNTPFTGAIDELQIYEGAMSAAKAKERYEANKPTGISTERTLRPDVNVYPLYFTDEITIEFPVEVSGRAMVSMYSVRVRLCIRLPIWWTEEQHVHQWAGRLAEGCLYGCSRSRNNEVCEETIEITESIRYRKQPD